MIIIELINMLDKRVTSCCNKSYLLGNKTVVLTENEIALSRQNLHYNKANCVSMSFVHLPQSPMCAYVKT